MTKTEMQGVIDRMTKQNASLIAEAKELKENLKQFMDARTAFGVIEPESKEPETEVGQLRRELAYAQGQLHQSYLCVKELCRPGGRGQFGYGVVEQKPAVSDEDSSAIRSLVSNTREILAMFANFKDLAGAGIRPPVDQHARAVEVFEKGLGKEAKRVKYNSGHGDEGPFTSTA